jgi:hypothetical protein
MGILAHIIPQSAQNAIRAACPQATTRKFLFLGAGGLSRARERPIGCRWFSAVPGKGYAGRRDRQRHQHIRRRDRGGESHPERSRRMRHTASSGTTDRARPPRSGRSRACSCRTRARSRRRCASGACLRCARQEQMLSGVGYGSVRRLRPVQCRVSSARHSRPAPDVFALVSNTGVRGCQHIS